MKINNYYWNAYVDGCVLRLEEAPMSMSVCAGEVYLVVLHPNKSIYTSSGETKYTAGGQGAILMVDRVYIRNGFITCNGQIRQIVEITWANDPKYRDLPITDQFYLGSEKSNAYLRKLCEERGALIEVVPGEMTPICRPNEVLVRAYNMSGTKYYRVPAYAYAEIKRAMEKKEK